MADGFGIRSVEVRGFRSARAVQLAPGAVCALVGGPSVGKSNLLDAIWTLLQNGEPAPSAGDVSARDGRAIELRATLGSGDELTLTARPGAAIRASGSGVPVLFFPAALRAQRLVASPVASPAAARVADEHFRVRDDATAAAGAGGFLAGVEGLCRASHGGLVLLIEEPELFLRPQAQRYLYRRLREFASAGNQVIYSTHEPAFLNVGRLDELALVGLNDQHGTTVTQPRPLDAGASFRAISEIDGESGELFLASSVMLVEGRTEKLTLPFVFSALGYDADGEAITIVDCGGKPNIPLFIRICHAVNVPCVAIHDRDALPEREPSHAERALNAEIRSLAGAGATFELARDFEAVAGLRGHRHKPTQAYQHFSQIGAEDVPVPLRDAVEKAIELARADAPAAIAGYATGGNTASGEFTDPETVPARR